MTESIESLSDWANVQFPNADKSLELLPKVLEQCWTTETSLKTRADVERQRAQAQFRLLHGRLKSSLSLLQSVRSDKRSLEAIVRTLEAPSPLLAETQTKARQLTRLQEAKKHLQVLSKVYDLTDRIDMALKMDTDQVMAFDYFTQLCSVVETVSLSHLDLSSAARVRKVNQQLQDVAAKKLEQDLAAIEWPNPLAIASLDTKHLKYLFQMHALLLSSKQEPGTPYAFKVFAKLPGRAFKFHFSGTRETNRMDRPEWFLKYLKDAIREKMDFFETQIQPVASGNIDAFGSFAVELCRFARLKLHSELPNLSASSDILIHTIHETIQFDKGLKEAYPLSPAIQQWLGLAHVFCEDTDVFALWLQQELEKASIKLEDLVTSGRAWEADLIGEPGALVGSNILVDLIDSMTDEYRALGSIPHRKVFFNEVQLPLLEYFLQQVRSRVQELADVFKPIGTLAASLETLWHRLTLLSKYLASLYQIKKWLDVWSINMVLVLEDADAGIFEDVVDAYRLLADRTEEIILEDFLSAVKNSLWSYHPINRRKSASSIHESDTLKEVTPSLIKSIEIIDRGLEIFQTHLAEALFKSLLLRVFANLRDLAKWSPTDWELGVESTFLKRGATFM